MRGTVTVIEMLTILLECLLGRRGKQTFNFFQLDFPGLFSEETW
jgi:hypothetical protein